MSAASSQSVVLQFGPQSNGCLVHLWNSLTAQAALVNEATEEAKAFCRSALLWRDRRDDPKTWHPRAVVFEERSRSALITTEEEASVVEGDHRGWRRDSFVSFAPKSLVPVDHSVPELETALESIRHLVEDCDTLRRFLVSIDSDGAWGQYGSKVLVAARDTFGPPHLDILPIFGGGQQQQPAADQALNLYRLSLQEDARIFPLLLTPDLSLDAVTQCQIAGLWETLLTEDVFPRFPPLAAPHGFSSLHFGTRASGLITPAELRPLTASPPPGPRTDHPPIDYCIGRADGVDRRRHPEFLDLSIYLADPQDGGVLRTASSLLAIDHGAQGSLRSHVRRHLLGTTVQRLLGSSWSEVREALERAICDPPYLQP